MKTKQRLITPLTPELCCSDIKNSLVFYCDVLGFSIQYQREEYGFAMLERQGSRIMLDQLSKDSWLPGSMEIPYGRGINLEISTDNIDELYDRVKKANGTIFLPLEEKWYRADEVLLGRRQFIVLDPDGYMLRFAENIGERSAHS